jgi:uncharacterized membrane protein
MNRSPMKNLWLNLRADVGAGLLLMLPLTVALFILHRLWSGIHAPVRALAEKLGVDGVLKVNGLLLVTLVVLFLIVIAAGRIARGRGEGRLRRWAEKRLLKHIPGYMYARIILEAKLGLVEPPLVRPALLLTGDGLQPVFHVEPLEGGRCVVYVPGVPLGASGSVLIVEVANVQLLEGSVARLDQALRSYGKGLGALLKGPPAE